MHRSTLKTTTILAALFATTTVVSANDWPRWRGADGTGVSTESGWSSTGKTEALWSGNFGWGHTSFAVSKGRVITAGYHDDLEADKVVCLNTTTGKEIWSHTIPCEKWDKGHTGGSLSTPVIEDDRVYVLNRDGIALCLSFADGSVVWEKNLMEHHELEYPTWKFSASPLIAGDKLIINVGRTIALDKSSGSALWETRDTGHAYSTPHPITANGRDCVLVFNSKGLAAFDATTGKEIAFKQWETQYNINAATPIISDGNIFISSGQNRGCAMLNLTEDAFEVVWENKSMANKMTGCILWEGHLYGFDEAELKCIDTEGNEKWSKRGLGNGSLMAADGKLIVITGKGELIVAQATPDEYKELSNAKVLDGGNFWAMPVLSNGLIFCRSSTGEVVCRDHRAAVDG